MNSNKNSNVVWRNNVNKRDKIERDKALTIKKRRGECLKGVTENLNPQYRQEPKKNKQGRGHYNTHICKSIEVNYPK